MAALLTDFFHYSVNLPWLELVAMMLALAYIILASAGSIWCWPAAFVSTALYTYIFYDVQLLMDSVLNIYYLAMAVYGYWIWQQDQANRNKHHTSSISIVSWSLSFHLKACYILTFIALFLGYVMANYTSAAFPYLDTFTTVFAVFATYLVAQKILENWLYWVVIDGVSIYVYIEKDLMPTVVLFGFYTIFATWGYFKWQSLYKKNRKTITVNVKS